MACTSVFLVRAVVCNAKDAYKLSNELTNSILFFNNVKSTETNTTQGNNDKGINHNFREA